MKQVRDNDYDEEHFRYDESGGNSSVVERDLAKVEVAGSNPASRSIITLPHDTWEMVYPSVSGDRLTHRLHCGDAGDDKSLRQLHTPSSGEMWRLMFTSPPYATQRNYQDAHLAPGRTWTELMQAVCLAAPLVQDGQMLVNLGLIFTDGAYCDYWMDWRTWMQSMGYRLFGWYVWDKGTGLPMKPRGRLVSAHEWVLHFNRQRPSVYNETVVALSWNPNQPLHTRREPDTRPHADAKDFYNATTAAGVTRRTRARHGLDSVCRVTRGARVKHTGHPAPYPPELPEYFIPAYTNPGEIVYDPFSGVGATWIACLRQGRTFRGCELSPMYVDATITRVIAETAGQTVITLVETGESFQEVTARRRTN